MKIRYYFIGALIVVALTLAFTFGLSLRGKVKVIANLQSTMQQLKNGWAMTSAIVLQKQDMIERLQADNADLAKKYRSEATARAELQVKLDAVSGHGPAVVDENKSAELDTTLLWVRYNFGPRTFDWRLKPRPLKLTLMRLQSSEWVASAFDQGLNLKVPVTGLDVIECPVDNHWWQSLGLGVGLGYVGMPLVGAGLEYKKSRLLGLAGYDDELKVGGFYYKKF